MYLLVTLTCGLAALALHWLLAGAGEMRNYAELQLESAVRGAVQEEVRSYTEANR